MLRNSLRFRVIFAFCLFCAITAVTYTGFVIFTLMSSEDDLFNHRISLEIDEFVSRYTEDARTPLPSSAYLQGYIGEDKLPPQYRCLVEDKPDGIYEYDDDIDLHVGITPLPGTADKLYIFYNTERLEIHGYKLKSTITLLLISIVFFLVLALLFSFAISDRMIHPVIRLADIIKRGDPSQLRTGFSKAFYHDEVGFLARTLEQYLDRMNQTIQEEKRFSAEVSHELRTPVTAIKGALDVIHRRGADQAGNMARPLARIDRAVLDMESLIETFLTLSRIRGHLPEKEIIEVRPFIQDIVGQNAYLLRKKSVMVDIRADDALTINQSPMVFKIAISNLIRNAFQYTRQGDIHIIADDSMIRVSDTGEGFSVDTGLSDNNYSPAVQTSSEGFGIGLSIVQRLCGRAGWQLNVTSKKGHGTCVDLKHTR